MSNDDQSNILPPMMGDRPRASGNRALLGLLLALLFVAVVLALWFLLFADNDSATADGDQDFSVAPTALPLPTSTPLPLGQQAGVTPVAPTTAPVATPTSVPEGFEACTDDRAPAGGAAYIVDTNTTPLNQRAEPAVSAELAGTFDPGQTGLVFTGDCVVNLGDGYVWWQINNGTTDVWIASDFVTRN